MTDFEELLRSAKVFKQKVILDFVPNHSSDQNAMFMKSARREPGFEDFYIWHPGKPNPVKGERPLPPNNWISLFRFSAWTWNEVRGEYYYHAFLPQQPDLNYRNPKVVEEMKNVLRFWLAKGVDGFRIDAVPNLFEVQPDARGDYPDEPKSGNSDDPDDYGYLNHIYTQDQPETVDMVYQWRAVMDEFQREHGGDTRIIMTETYSNIDIVMQYYGNATTNGAHIPFNFQLIMGINNSSTAADFKRITDLWLDKMPQGRTANWVMGNHDNNRVASRLGTHKVDVINMILMTLPGVSVTYNGDEIGMTDVWISWADTVDPEACRTNPDVYMKVSRDPERTPFQWGNSTSAGFSSNPKTWLPVSPDYQTVNAAAQLKSENNTHLKVFVQLAALRESLEVQFGTYQSFVVNEVFVIHRKLGDSSVLTVANLGAARETIDLTIHAKVKKVLLYWILDSSSPNRK
jgi:alpha-glucosidase